MKTMLSKLVDTAEWFREKFLNESWLVVRNAFVLKTALIPLCLLSLSCSRHQGKLLSGHWASVLTPTQSEYSELSIVNHQIQWYQTGMGYSPKLLFDEWQQDTLFLYNFSDGVKDTFLLMYASLDSPDTLSATVNRIGSDETSTTTWVRIPEQEPVDSFFVIGGKGDNRKYFINAFGRREALAKQALKR